MFWSGSSRLVRDLRYPAIDGLRFYAALLVFQVHALNAAWVELLGGVNLEPVSTDPLSHHILFFFADGAHGVDIFFVISGFLVGRMVFGREGRFHYGRFVWERFARIYPAFLASLVVTTAYFCFLLGQSWSFSVTRFVGNLLFLNAVPSLGIAAYNGVTWSLFYEFAYYLVLPVFLLLSRLVGRKWTAVILLGCALALLQTAAVRAVPLFAGTILAALDDDELAAFARRVPLIVPLVCYFGLMSAKGVQGLSHFEYTTYIGFLAPIVSLLLVKLVFDDSWLSRIASTPIARVLGTISYSFYLWQLPCLYLVRYQVIPSLGLQGTPAAVFLVFGSFALTVLVSIVSYLAFERRYFGNHKPSTAIMGACDSTVSPQTGPARRVGATLDARIRQRALTGLMNQQRTTTTEAQVKMPRLLA
jgi:peptidoglycan/LPS O-acetylase OafA/YrhL